MLSMGDFILRYWAYRRHNFDNLWWMTVATITTHSLFLSIIFHTPEIYTRESSNHLRFLLFMYSSVRSFKFLLEGKLLLHRNVPH